MPRSRDPSLADEGAARYEGGKSPAARPPEREKKSVIAMAQQVATAPLPPAPGPAELATHALAESPGQRPFRSPRHTYGAIDLGTNNCRLLVARPAEDGFTVIDAFSRVVRLGEGMATQRQDQRSGDGPRRRRALGLRREAEAPPRLARPLGRHRGLPPRRQRPPVRRAGAARDRHLPRDHRARGGSAARHARLPPAARARRRPGPDLRHRRRLDRAGADRHRRRASRGSNAGGARPGAWSR